MLVERKPAPFKSTAGAFYAFPHLRSRIEIIHRRRLVVPHRHRRLHRRSARRIERITSAKVGPPRRGKLFTYGKGERALFGRRNGRRCRPDALCSGCLKFLSVLYHRPVSLYSLFLRFYALFRRARRMRRLHRRRNATRACTVVVKISRGGCFAVQRETFHGEVD